MKKRGIKYYSFLEPSGYGLSALSYLNALLDMNCPIHWVPLIISEKGYRPWYQFRVGQPQVESLLNELLPEYYNHKINKRHSIDRLKNCLESSEQYDSILMHVVPEFWPYLIEPDKLHVGYTVWETTILPNHFPDLINQVDQVLVPSSFNQPIFKKSGVKIPIDVVPHVLNSSEPVTTQLINDIRMQSAVPSDNYVFYTINTWTARKNLGALVHSYLNTFSNNDQVSLIIKTSTHGPASELDNQKHETKVLISSIIDQYRFPAHISVINHDVSQSEIAALHEIGDCFVSTSHSEGWGLGMFEAAGAGNPVIATGWGGHLDFLSDKLSYLTRFSFTQVIDKLGESSYSQNQSWAKPDPNSISEQLMKVYRGQDIAKEKAIRLAEQLHQNYNSKNIGTQLYQSIYG